MEINNYWVVGLPIDIDTDINIDMLSAVEKFKRATYIRENPKRFLNELNEDSVDTENMKYYYIRIEDIVDEIYEKGQCGDRGCPYGFAAAGFEPSRTFSPLCERRAGSAAYSR